MALIFKYRYVDLGTVFTGASGIRDAGSGDDCPGTLYANELVTDVGGTCWDRNEPLSIIDHHFSSEGQFPSASAAVLHKAKLIREKFATGQFNTIWLVTHKQPDFDAFCSLYLARWIIEDPGAVIDWEPYGLHPDGWLDSSIHARIDWFDSDFRHVPFPQRWALLLACFASILDNGRHLPCPPQRALHSVLYAALKRGRDYGNESSGAREFFDEVKPSIQHKQLNPIFDSVLEGCALFAPELAMLDREVEAYRRDIGRARKSVVYLPESEAPFPNFFKSVRDVAGKEKQAGKSREANAGHLLLADTFRIPTDGVYLRDPECLLFKEWARLDLENSSLGAGFEFTAIAYSGRRPTGAINQTEYVFSIDPERANGRHLYTVWSRLQTKEVEAIRTQEKAGPPEATGQRPDLEKRHGDLGRVFTDPWFDGHNCFGTMVSTPNRGTMIGRPGVRGDLRDDPTAESVRTEIEDSIYTAESLVSGPQVLVTDFSGSRTEPDTSPRLLELSALQQIPAPHARYFRFATIGLRANVPILPSGVSRHGLAEQIAETLWQVLDPDSSDAGSPDFIQRHLVATTAYVGVWGERGIVVAHKGASSDDLGREVSGNGGDELREGFASIVALAREADQLIADGKHLPAPPAIPADDQPATDWVAKFIAHGENVALHAAQVKQNLALPHRELLRAFYEATGIEGLLVGVRELNQFAVAHLQQAKLQEQAGRLEDSAKTVAELQSKLKWLGVFVAGFNATVVIGLFIRSFPALNEGWGTPFTLLGGLFCLLLAAAILKPWKRDFNKKAGSKNTPVWILGFVAASYIVGLLLWLLIPAHPAR